MTRLGWLAGLVLLTGCATRWQPGPGMTTQEWAQVQYVCARDNQPAPTLPAAAYKSNVVYAGGYQPGALTAGGAALGAGIRARKLYNMCMGAAGAVEAER